MAKLCISSGLAAAMKRDLTAWIKAERIARDLGAEIAQLPVGDWTSLVGPRFKGPIFHHHAEAKDKARGCEKKVRENEHVNYELPALFLSRPASWNNQIGSEVSGPVGTVSRKGLTEAT